MASFDVVKLFTSVLRKEVMQKLQERLVRDHKLLDRTVLGEQNILELVTLWTQYTFNLESISMNRHRVGHGLSVISNSSRSLYGENRRDNKERGQGESYQVLEEIRR
jgi:hypothetical protein